MWNAEGALKIQQKAQWVPVQCSISTSLNNLATEPKPTLEVPPATLLCFILLSIFPFHTVLYLDVEIPLSVVQVKFRCNFFFWSKSIYIELS